MADGALRPQRDDDRGGLPDAVLRALSRTPARAFVGRAGTGYRTGTWLKLREDHAAARDAVHAELDLARDLGTGLIQRFGLFEVRTRAGSKAEYLARPDLGRRLSDDARAAVADRCPTDADLQIVIGDGLSAAAVTAQVPALLPRLADESAVRGWRLGRPFVVRYCRVGVMNDVGDLLRPGVVVLLVGERPGLAAADSLSAYLAYRPRPGHTDADRNLISNVHARGVGIEEAAARIASYAAGLFEAGRGGVGVTEPARGSTAGRLREPG